MGINKKFTTLGIGTTWLWELFPYTNTYPTAGEFGANSPGGPTIDAMPDATSSILSNSLGSIKSLASQSNAVAAFNAGQLSVSGPGELATLGLKNFSINRSKNAPDGSCNLTTIGQPPKNAYPGVWCCMTSINPQNGQRRIRFIGQISSMTVNYQTIGSGLVTTVTSYQIREWSSILRVAVRVEALTLSQAMTEPTPYNSATFAANKLGEKTWATLIQASYNPFDMATLVLQLLGAVSSDNSKNLIKELADKNYQETAARMPIIPPALAKRLGVNSNSTNPFASGFVKFINGVRKDSTNPKIGDGSWDGVFGRAGYESINDYQERHDHSKNTGRPVGSNIGSLMSLNLPGWDLLAQYCDPAHNEFFTDMLYEVDASGNEVTQPVFVFRDKPFLLQNIKDVIPDNARLDKFSLFDTLPRIKLNSAAIINVGFTNTILNSPNLVRVDWTDGFTNPDMSKQAANANGYNLLLPEMLRHGGQEYNAQTNFVVLDPSSTEASGFTSADWWSTIRDVVTAWHAYTYRMGNAVVTLKDDNTAISLGNNVEFEMGNFTLVGHVDSINFSVVIDERGNLQNTMQVSLSRVIQKDKDGKLIFISPKQFGQLANPQANPEAPESIKYPNLPGPAQLLNGIVSTVKGFLK